MATRPSERLRAEAYSGKGFGALRRQLQEHARDRIKNSIRRRFFCEAIAITESAIADRLESRLSFLEGKNAGFMNLGPLLGRLGRCEDDVELKALLNEIDAWRRRRNEGLHELVKVEAVEEPRTWQQRM